MTKLESIALNLAEAVFGGSPQNATARPQPQQNQPPFEAEAGRNAAAIESSVPPSARKESPMDRASVIRPKPDMLAGVAWPSPTQCTIYNERLRESGYYDGPPDSLREQLAALDEKWLRLQDAIAETSRNQRPVYLAHRADLAQRVADGGPADEKDGWSSEDFAEDAVERRAAFKAKAKEIEVQAWAIAQPELLKKASAVNAMADELQQREFDRAEGWGFRCMGPWVLSLRKWAVSLSDGSRACVGKPSAMLESL